MVFGHHNPANRGRQQHGRALSDMIGHEERYIPFVVQFSYQMPTVRGAVVKITNLLPENARRAAEQSKSITQHFFYGDSAAQELSDTLMETVPGTSVVVFSDDRTRGAAGEACLAALKHSGWEVRECRIPDGPDGTDPECDGVTKGMLAAHVPQADAYVAVGSGVVNDLAKWLASDAGVPYAVYATAASMNGYASANVAGTVDGVKRLFLGRAPLVVAADPQVIARAPHMLTTAGLGDVIAKPVSNADWLVGSALFGEEYSDVIAGMISALEPSYVDRPEAVGQCDPAALRALFEALVLSGCAMTLQGSSVPASGGEHLISHTIDMKSSLDGRPHDRHGRQVGVATIFASALYQHILAVENPVFGSAALVFDDAYWGGIRDAVHAQFTGACENMAQACTALSSEGTWDRLRATLSPVLRKPAWVKDCLRRAGAAHCLDDIGCTREQFSAAVRNGAGIRARFTSLDLGHCAGVLPDKIEDIIDEWLIS